ncbi:MAG: hypothetical protein QM765_39025 [Myxococcales bacterium]
MALTWRAKALNPRPVVCPKGCCSSTRPTAFLQDRRRAFQRWEVTETNEFLQQFERLSGVVVCTNNLFRDLDQAALRRFSIKVPFLPVRPEQAVMLFERFFAPEWDAATRQHVARESARIPSPAPGGCACWEFGSLCTTARRARRGGRREGAHLPVHRLLSALREVGAALRPIPFARPIAPTAF